MKHEKHPKSFRADDFCTTCNRTTRHAITVLGENETTVRNSRSCDTCGTRLNYFSPVRFFKLLAAGAILSLLIYFGWNKETLLCTVLTATSRYCMRWNGMRHSTYTITSNLHAPVRPVTRKNRELLTRLYGVLCYVVWTSKVSTNAEAIW